MTTMSNKPLHEDTPFNGLKNESARQRWELFHRAIAHAKQSNTEALEQGDGSQADPGADPVGSSLRGNTRLSLAR